MELSLRIGVSREAVSRILHRFKASGALSPLRGRLIVRDRDILDDLAS